ncbi:MAG: hypothetical protein HQK53_07935 [Oligoflexia bacterium]|nr:hypothetical protein [Oligoflexia bacterium]
MRVLLGALIWSIVVSWASTTDGIRTVSPVVDKQKIAVTRDKLNELGFNKDQIKKIIMINVWANEDNRSTILMRVSNGEQGIHRV